MAKPVQLDAEVAIRLWGFRWHCSRKNNPNQLCVLHVPDSWLESGWYRCNWGPETHDLLPEGTLWPIESYSPYEDWYNGVCKEDDLGRNEWYTLPPFSSDWKACGMVMGWLTKNCSEWIIKSNGVKAQRFNPQSGQKEEIAVVNYDDNLPTLICKLAVEVCVAWDLGVNAKPISTPTKEMAHPFGYHADLCSCPECV